MAVMSTHSRPPRQPSASSAGGCGGTGPGACCAARAAWRVIIENGVVTGDSSAFERDGINLNVTDVIRLKAVSLPGDGVEIANDFICQSMILAHRSIGISSSCDRKTTNLLNR